MHPYQGLVSENLARNQGGCRGGEAPSWKYFAPLEKCFGHSLKVLDVVKKSGHFSENYSIPLVSHAGYGPAENKVKIEKQKRSKCSCVSTAHEEEHSPLILLTSQKLQGIFLCKDQVKTRITAKYCLTVIARKFGHPITGIHVCRLNLSNTQTELPLTLDWRCSYVLTLHFFTLIAL